MAGSYIDALLSITFGEVRFVFPIILAIIGILIIQDLDYHYRSTHLIGALLFFASFNGLVHLQNLGYDRALMGTGGGLIGYAVSTPLHAYTGYWGATVILAGILLASLIFLFNTSLAELIGVHRKVLLGLGWIGRVLLAFFGAFRRDERPGEVKVVGDHEGDHEEEDATEEGMVEEEPEQQPEKKADKVSSKASPEPEPEPEEELEEEQDAEEIIESEKMRAPETIQVEKPKRIYHLPPLDILFTSKSKPTSGDIKSSARIIQETFQNFGIDVEMGEVRVGPTVTQFSFKPARGVKLTRITTLSNDLALALAAHPIRIEAPIPGKSLVGIEVPNQKVAMSPCANSWRVRSSSSGRTL
jgi:S-DNA-T family DNA segregation ATPase FtsK/SpoIIIE